MTSAWLDKPDNPGMDQFDVTSADVYGLIVLIHFAKKQWKVAVTPDFDRVLPVTYMDQLNDLDWLDDVLSKGSSGITSP